MKILAVVNEAIDADALRSAVGSDAADGAEVLVIAPALNSKLRFWVSDPDPAINRAQDVAQESVERMEEEGIDAAGGTGDSDPLQAVQDSLATFPAEEIVLCTHRSGKGNWLEERIVEKAQERFPDRIVRHLEMD